MNEPALEADLRLCVGRGPARFEVRSELRLEAGVLVLFGPSGAGKTLTLEGIAGLIRPVAGRVRVGGRTLSDEGVWVPPHRRRIGYVPQHHSLFPFRSVRENVAFGLPRRDRRGSAVESLLEELGLGGLARARPESLSGGERQRVALARALAPRPSLLLLDEPFASIDREGRAGLRRLLRETLEHHHTPAVFVTHDPEEAGAIGDVVARFERGRTIGQGPPATVLKRGAAVRVRGVLRGVPRSAGDGRVEAPLDEARVDAPTDALPAEPGAPVDLSLREED